MDMEEFSYMDKWMNRLIEDLVDRLLNKLITSD